MRINLPWNKMEEKELKLWNKFLDNYGCEMEENELDFLEQSYKKWTGNHDFEIKKIMMFGMKKDEIKF